MPKTCEDIFNRFCRHDAGAGDDDAVDVQFDFAHGLHRRAQGGDIVLKVDKGARDPVRVFREHLKLGCQGLRGSDLVGLLPGVCDRLIHDPVQPPALQVHRLDDLRIDLVEIVVPETVGIDAGEHQDLPVDLIEPEDAVVKLLEDAAHPAERRLKTQGVPPAGQVELVPFCEL